MKAAAPLTPADTIALLRRRYPAALICVVCALLIATTAASYANSNLTEAARLAYVCAGCRLQQVDAERGREARTQNLVQARAAKTEQRAEQRASADGLLPWWAGAAGEPQKAPGAPERVTPQVRPSRANRASGTRMNTGDSAASGVTPQPTPATGPSAAALRSRAWRQATTARRREREAERLSRQRDRKRASRASRKAVAA